MRKTDIHEMIKVLNEIISRSIKVESEGELFSMINLSARAELSIRKNNPDDMSLLEKEISEIILKYKSNNS